MGDWSILWSSGILVVAALVLLTAGVRLVRLADELADRTGLGEALFGAVMLGAVTSLPGLVTTVVGAASGEAGFAVSNGIGGIAAQTAFLAVADLTYRRANLEHAAASVPNLTQTMVLVALIGVVLAATSGPDITLLGVHPATVLLVAMYLYGLRLTHNAEQRPMWRPRSTDATVVDAPQVPTEKTLRSLWAGFLLLGAVVGGTGWAVGTAGLSIAEDTGLSGSLVGAAFTSIVTSLPELVTAIAAVRIGALTLAVGDIVGGNTFDVLFIAAADVAFRGGSIYHAVDPQAVFLLALTIVLTGTLAGGMLQRDRRHIGFEGIAIFGFYVVGMVALVAMG